jgi:hypothetical protein
MTPFFLPHLYIAIFFPWLLPYVLLPYEDTSID